jgi:hypothetical protein
MTLAIALASPDDDAGVRELLRTQPMPGRVRLAFCREPDFSTGCAVTGEDPRILVARGDDGQVVGVACRSVRRVFLNGREQRIGYLGQLRVHARHRGRWLVSRGFAMLEAIHQADPLPAYLASIVDGNEEATGVLVRRPRRMFPAFHEVARYLTLAIRVRRGARGQPRTRSAPALSEVASFLGREGPRRQLNTAWSTHALERLSGYGLRAEDIHVARVDGAIAGVMALWDQSAYKQSIIHGYSGWLRAAAPVLPRPGTKLRSAYVSLVCVAHDDVRVFESLLREIHEEAAARGFEYLLIGFDARDPLLAAARAYPHVVYPSRLYLATWPTGGPAHEPLDARPVYVDVATL